MKRKFLSTLLFGALACTTLSTVTSCKDYDDDINNLQEQINKAALSSDVEALKTQVSNVQTAASTAQATAEKALSTANDAATKAALAEVKATADKAAQDVATAIANAAKAQETADAAQTKEDAAKAAKDAQDYADAQIKAAVEKIEAALGDKADKKDLIAAIERIAKLEQTAVTAESLKNQLDSLKEEILAAAGNKEAVEALSKKVEAYKSSVNELYSAVTSVELVGSYSYYNGQGHKLGWGGTPIDVTLTHGLVAESSVFGDEAYKNADPLVNFTKGADIKDPKAIIVRVNPVNADLTKGAKIMLINSKGESLEDIVKVGTPERYNELLTRASKINSGLWTLPLTVASGVTEEQFKEAVKVTNEDGSESSVLYAVAINNSTDSVAADRYVVSTYDVTTGYKAYAPANDFTFEVGGKNISEIKNRWNGSKVYAEDGTEGETPEYAWAESTEDVKTPATAAVTKGDGKNVIDDVNDARIGKDLLQVGVNKPFSLKGFVGTLDGEKISIDHYYVTLDKANAIESAPSEWNAWASYTIDGLYKNVPADSVLALNVKSGAAEGDIIGFRVYAVNRDGSLVDPDGKAFYVLVGEAANANLNGKFLATATTVNTDTLDVAFASGVNYGAWEITNGDKKEVFGNNTESLPSFTPHYLDKDGKATTDLTKAKKVFFTISDVAKIVDGATVQLSIEGTKYVQGQQVKASTIAASYKKVLPTTFGAKLEFRPKQEVTDGSGQFILYMKPSEGWAATTISTTGVTDLNNVFYNLDEKVELTFADAQVDPEDATGKKIIANVSNNHSITEGVKFIDSKTWHNVVANYNYGYVSYKWDAKANTYKTAPVSIASTKSLSAQFACWETANKYDWGTYRHNDGTTEKPVWNTYSYKPELQWSAAGTTETTDLGVAVLVKNSYNNDFFGGALKNIITDAKYLVVDTETPVQLTYGTQVNPYFKAEYNNGVVTFTQIGTQVENAPVADHEETLVVPFKDAYGHKTSVKVPVTIKTAAKANAKKH